jgi:hypothetical protein
MPWVASIIRVCSLSLHGGKDKKAVDDFFYSGLHQSWVRQRGLAMTSGRAVPVDQMPTQTAVEIFAGLPPLKEIGPDAL